MAIEENISFLERCQGHARRIESITAYPVYRHDLEVLNAHYSALFLVKSIGMYLKDLERVAAQSPASVGILGELKPFRVAARYLRDVLERRS